MIRGLELWASLTSRKGVGTRHWAQSRGQWFNESCLYNETPIKTLVAEAYWNVLVNKLIILKGWQSWIQWGECTEALHFPHPHLPLYEFLFSCFWPVTGTWVILGSVSHSSELSNLKRVGRLLNVLSVGQKYGWSGDSGSTAGIWSNGSLGEDWALNLWSSVLTPGG